MEHLAVFRSSSVNAQEKIIVFPAMEEDTMFSGHDQCCLEMVTVLYTQHSFPYSSVSVLPHIKGVED